MSDRDVHALLSPSGAAGWLVCPGKLFMEKGLPDNAGDDAKWGTAGHEVAKMALVEDRPASAYIGRRVSVSAHETIEVTDEMAEHVQTYVDGVHATIERYKLAGATSVELLIEQRVPIGHITGEEGAEGTADVVIIVLFADGTALIHVIDLKLGRGIKVYSENNPQGMLYALGAVEKFAVVTDFDRVVISIHQPRVDEEPSEWEIPIAELQKFSRHASERAFHALAVYNTEKPEAIIHHLRAGDHCRKTFCKARATCPKLGEFVEESVGADFEVIASTPVKPDEALSLQHGGDPAKLRAKFEAIGIIEDWCKAVRARVEAVLFEAQNSPEIIEQLGVKLVEGKLGNRSWADEEAAKKMLREQFRLTIEQAFKLELKSPPQIETLAPKFNKKGEVKKPKEGEPPPVIGEVQWKKLQALIVRKPGQPSVAPATDPRAPLVVKPVADDFATIEAQPGDDLV